jgi:hypothetical protein
MALFLQLLTTWWSLTTTKGKPSKDSTADKDTKKSTKMKFQSFAAKSNAFA